MSHQVVSIDQIPKNSARGPESPNTKVYNEIIAAVDDLPVGKALEIDLSVFPRTVSSTAFGSNMRTRWNAMGRPKHLYRCVRRKVEGGEPRVFVFRLEEDSSVEA